MRYNRQGSLQNALYLHLLEFLTGSLVRSSTLRRITYHYYNGDITTRYYTKYFPTSLSGEALKWFDGIPVGTIRSIHHQKSIFLGSYIINNMLRPGIEMVFILRRITNESLRNLTTRWRTLCSEMTGRIEERNLILAFINALFSIIFLYTQIFRIKYTIKMRELWELQEEYITLEENQIKMELYHVALANTK